MVAPFNIDPFSTKTLRHFWQALECTMVRFEKRLEDFQSLKLLSLILAVFWYIMAGLN